ncbi:basic leucine zipper 34-like [Mercurialis annua]|uniref:basic leucine zipper 34-like n=1 Tax=Mercurialis annua TaxID=3986 RepID=UPI00215F225D|nr:basic leucine zipper 34-like [Mercurialis annua]
MENPKRLSVSKSFSNPERQDSSHPRNPFQFTFQSYRDSISNFSAGESRLVRNPLKGVAVHHHRAASDGYLIDIEQPSWLDELLKEPDSPAGYKACHRRSSSDSAALLNSASNTTGLLLSSNNNITAEISGTSGNVQKSGGSVLSKAIIKKNQERIPHVKSDSSITTSTASASKSDSKRAKQQLARNSRLRKLQYIAELERSVQFLQAKGFEATAALQYHNEEILILGMENRALKQRLDNISQEQLIKYMEQDMLEREIARLQMLYHQQQQQKEENQKAPMHYLHQTKSREIKLQLAKLCI